MGSPSKIVPLSDAVRTHVRDGDTVFVGGFGQGVPFASGREIVRQGKHRLTLCRTGADILFDLLVAGGVARAVIFGWYGNPGVGISHVLRRAVADRSLSVEETSNFGLLLRLHAGALGVPFLPTRTLTLGDLPGVSPAHATVVCPFTGVELAAVSALRPDVALVHAQRSDAHGNVQLRGIVGDTLEGARAARRVVCTVEEIVPEYRVLAQPEQTLLPASMVSSVSLAPFGAHPSYVDGYYGRDDDAYRAFDRLSRDPAKLDGFITATIRECADHAAYVERFADAAERLRRSAA